jgi:hypothetical protein
MHHILNLIIIQHVRVNPSFGVFIAAYKQGTSAILLSIAPEGGTAENTDSRRS